MAHGAINLTEMYANNRYPAPGGDGMAMMANLTAGSSSRKRAQVISDDDDEEQEQIPSKKKEDLQEVIAELIESDKEKPKEEDTDRSKPENCEHETQ